MRKIANTLLQINYLLFVVVVLLIFALVNIAEAKEIKVMVIDTGIDYTHPAISSYILHPKIEKNAKNSIRYGFLDTEAYMDYKGHGTHVTGIILRGEMSHSNTVGTPVCSQVKIIPCKAFGNNIAPIQASTACLRMAADLGVDYVNYSAGGYAYSKIEEQAFKDLDKKGITVIAAAGNDGRNIYLSSPNKDEKVNVPEYKYYPASYDSDRVIAVMAAEADGKIWVKSNRSVRSKMPIERGVNVYSTLPNGGYGYMTGTSQAAPLYLHKLLIDKCKKMNDNHGER